ncbi:hypothetical protein [Thermococcus sp. ES12]|uniref:hypothetical protein n=1 Tax=Thermococcus sp. ES12 TaxID=1638246 RepID=UPI00142FB1F8|nr:hypothetical protein [Thermococcus sp. ES12]NJE75707.1 hypothetical protein [Thermococcus sp. ES12]
MVNVRKFISSMLVLVMALSLPWALHSKGDSEPERVSPILSAYFQIQGLLEEEYGTHVEIVPLYTTLWVRGECPNCTVVKAEGLVNRSNETYLVSVDLENGSVRLILANESVRESYIHFFMEHGGKVSDCNSVVKSAYNENWTARDVNGTRVVPAIVRVG